jgi:3-hydroxybutyryl-CoA dehydrogenase
MSMADSPQVEPTIGIIGGGRMGTAIAAIFAGEARSVLLVEPDESRHATIRAKVGEIADLCGRDPACIANVRLLRAIGPEIATCAFVIEAAPEKLPLKQAIFAELSSVCGPDVILATNTSVIPVDAIGSQATHRSRVIGTHFWNPPYAVRLVEVVQGPMTSNATVAATIDLMHAIGMLPVHVKKDVPGFIGNRLQHALKREAIALVQNGVCDAETVDFVVRNSFGARLGIMGPLEQSDLVGLGLTLDIHKVILADLDRSTEPQRLLVEKVAAGHTGASVGEGFRRWSPDERAELQTRLDRALVRKS